MDNVDNPNFPIGKLSRSRQASRDDRGADHSSDGGKSPLGELEELAGAGSGSGSRDATSRRAHPLDPRQVLTGIFTEFSARRKQEKVGAWMYLQTALAENAGILCPTAVSLKDLIAAEANIEDMLKGQQGDAGKSPQEYLEEWLSPQEGAAPEISQ